MACIQNDFEEGGVIYVRGQKAICKRTDEYPLIFWAFDSNPSVQYHRSLKDDADMFSIFPPEEETKEVNTTEKETKSPTKNESKDQPLTQTESKDDGSKTIYKNLKNDDITCKTEFPGTVHINKCVKTTVHIVNKLSNVTLTDCNEVTLNFLSEISSCKVSQSIGCQIMVSLKCATFTLDNCHKTLISFPHKTLDAVKVQSTQCKEIQLIARNEEDPSKELSYTYEESKESDEPTAFMTCFEKGAFSTTQLNPNTTNDESEIKSKEEKKAIVEEPSEDSGEKKTQDKVEDPSEDPSEEKSEPSSESVEVGEKSVDVVEGLSSVTLSSSENKEISIEKSESTDSG